MSLVETEIVVTIEVVIEVREGEIMINGIEVEAIKTVMTVEEGTIEEAVVVNAIEMSARAVATEEMTVAKKEEDKRTMSTAIGKEFTIPIAEVRAKEDTVAVATAPSEEASVQDGS
jgi:hypothetical protein